MILDVTLHWYPFCEADAFTWIVKLDKWPVLKALIFLSVFFIFKHHLRP